MIIRLLGIWMVIVVFLGSIGVPLYKHSCTSEQITIQTLFTSSDHCKKEALEHSDCCAQKEVSESLDDDCCTDEVRLLTLSFDYFQYAQDHPLIGINYSNIEIPLYFCVVTSTSRCYIVHKSDPPPIPLGERLPINCCWRL